MDSVGLRSLLTIGIMKGDSKDRQIRIDIPIVLTEEQRRKLEEPMMGCMEQRSNKGLLSWLLSKLG